MSAENLRAMMDEHFDDRISKLSIRELRKMIKLKQEDNEANRKNNWGSREESIEDQEPPADMPTEPTDKKPSSEPTKKKKKPQEPKRKKKQPPTNEQATPNRPAAAAAKAKKQKHTVRFHGEDQTTEKATKKQKGNNNRHQKKAHANDRGEQKGSGKKVKGKPPRH